MKPYQQAVLGLLSERPRTSKELYQHFNSDTGIRKGDHSKLNSWIKRNVRPLIRNKKVCIRDDKYDLVE